MDEGNGDWITLPQPSVMEIALFFTAAFIP